MTHKEDQNISEPVEQTEQRIHSNNYVLNELKRYEFDATDAYGRKVSTGTQNTIDVPSFYIYNPERLRFQVNDTRTDPADVPTKFADNEANFSLTPDAGESLTLQSAERARYVAGYESASTTGSKVETDLGSGDTVEIGLTDDSDPVNKAYFEINGGSDNRLVLVGEGTEVASQPFEYPEGIDEKTPIRYEIIFNWHNVGRHLFFVSYTNDAKTDGEKEARDVVGELVVDDDFATGDAAQHVYQKIDAATSGQELTVSSFGYSILGDISAKTRTKAARLSGLSYGGSGEYEALAAIQIDEPRGNVFTNLSRVTVFPASGSGELVVVVVRPSNTNATGFSTPPEHSPRNSVIEQTTNVSEFPDQDGNIVTSTTDPNGYQIGFATFEEAGTGTNTRQSPGAAIENKRPLYEDDVAIFLYKADTASSTDVSINYLTEQKW